LFLKNQAPQAKIVLKKSRTDPARKHCLFVFFEKTFTIKMNHRPGNNPVKSKQALTSLF
jgi:hypothetical protein